MGGLDGLLGFFDRAVRSLNFVAKEVLEKWIIQ